MVSVILHGCSGHMGQVVTDIIAADPDIEIVAGIDAVDLGNRDYPVFTDAAECSVPADAIIDFSTAKAVDVLLAYAVERNIPVVLCSVRPAFRNGRSRLSARHPKRLPFFAPRTCLSA